MMRLSLSLRVLRGLVASKHQKMMEIPIRGLAVASTHQHQKKMMEIPSRLRDSDSDSLLSTVELQLAAAASVPPFVVLRTREFTYYTFHQTQSELKEIVLPAAFVFVVGSCGRLFLIEHGRSSAMALLDPSTGKHHILPPNPAGNTNVRLCGFAAGKIVTIITNPSPGFPSLHLMIYDLNTGAWRHVPRRPERLLEGRNSGLLQGWTYANGSFYFERGDYEEFALGFDLDREEFFETFIPCWSKHAMAALDGNLCFIDMYARGGYDFWVTKEKNVKKNNALCWTKLFSISNPKTRFSKSDLDLDDRADLDAENYWVGDKYHYEHLFLQPLCYSPCRNKVLFDVNLGKLSWYNLETKEFEDFSIGDTIGPMCEGC